MELITQSDFENHVGLWKSKGHDHVVRVEFATVEDDELIILIVPDYCCPGIEYYMHVKEQIV